MFKMEDVLRNARGLSYTTGRFSELADWRLGAFFYFSQVAILVAVIVSLLLGKSYLKSEYPIGVISSHGYGAADFAAIQRLTYAGNVTAPCSNLADYAFQYDANVVYNQPLCTYAEPDEVGGRCRLTVSKPELKARAWFQRLKLKCDDEPLSNVACNCDVRRYNGVITKSTGGSVFVSTHVENKKVYRTPAATEAVGLGGKCSKCLSTHFKPSLLELISIL